MAGLFSFSFAGVGFLVIAAIECLALMIPFRRPSRILAARFTSAAALAVLFVLDSLISAVVSPSPRQDPLGAPLPLSSLPVAALFLLYAVAGLLSLHPSPSSPIFPAPSSLLDLTLLFAFFQELLLLKLRRKDSDGAENHYFDLLLVPVLACFVSTLLAIARPRSAAPRAARAAALALHGTWLVQMGFSFFSTAISHGCDLLERSRANYTIRCKGHPEYHRSSAIATLQFNGHLALLVVSGLGVYAEAAAGRPRGPSDGLAYRPLNKELQNMERISAGRFTLDSDDEGEEIIADEGANGSVRKRDVVLPMPAMNGSGDNSH